MGWRRGDGARREMTLLLPGVLGVLWHTVWVWAGAGEVWVSLLLLVLIVGLLAGIEAFARALAWAWAYNHVGPGLDALRWLRRLLPGSGRGDGSNMAAVAWADAEPVLWILIAVAGWAVAQFVTGMTDDVVGKIVLLAVSLTLLGLEILSGAWGDLLHFGGGGGGVECGGASSAVGVAVAAARAIEDAAAARHLTASLPLPPMLGGGGKGAERLTFKLDL